MTFHGSPPGDRRRRPLSRNEINSTAERLGNIVGVAARIALNDPLFNDYSYRQVGRNTDINGGVIVNRFDRFAPTVDRPAAHKWDLIDQSLSKKRKTSLLPDVREKMTKSQIAESQRRANAWLKAHGEKP